MLNKSSLIVDGIKIIILLIFQNMSLRRSQRNKSNHIKLNLKERIKTILDGNEKGIIIECYGDKGKGIKLIISTKI